MDNRLLEAALQYAGYGWHVIPVEANGKKPLTFRGLKDGTTDTATIMAWWTRWPQANVGIVTGEISGISVIDIDTAKGGQKSLDELIETYGPIPKTLTSATGGGGKHLVFRHLPGLRNSQGKLGTGIDTRGDGGYIVAPPSVHASGVAYAWDNESDPAEMPGWLNPGNLSDLDLSEVKPAKPDMYARCKAYLGKCPQAISGEGGHDKTFRAACECWRFGLSRGEVESMMNWFNATKCSPPWKQKELAHKIKDSHEKVAAEGKIGCREYENEMTWPEWEEVLPETVEIEMKAEKPKEEIKPFPDDLLHPTGLLGDVCKWINDTAIKPQPVYALANAIPFLGALFGRKVKTVTNLRTNIYSVSVGDSGTGKDHSRNRIKDLCETAGLTTHILGGEDLSSDTALFNAVYKRPSVLFQVDEAGYFLSSANSKYAASHQKNILPQLMKLFSAAGTIMLGKEFAGDERERKDIRYPNCCLYGTTTASTIYEGMRSREIGGGFLGRFLVFHCDSDPKDVFREKVDPPSEVIDQILRWWNWVPKVADKKANMADPYQHPITVPFTADGQAVIDAFRDACRDKRQDHKGDPKQIDALWARGAEHAIKLALIHACGVSPWVEDDPTPTIGAESASWACALIQYLFERLIHEVGRNVAENDFEKELLWFQEIIRQNSPITRSKIILKTRRLRASIREEYITSLIASGIITVKEEKATRGIPAKVYSYVGV